jgi:hypothetical protein
MVEKRYADDKPCCCNHHTGVICNYHQSFDPFTGIWTCNTKCEDYLNPECTNVTTCGQSVKAHIPIEE